MSYHLIQYDHYLLSGNNDLNTLLSLKNTFEESLLKLNESVKGMVESLKNKITEDFSKKREVISKFELAFEKMIKESENES
jgi:hypothetical protein